MRRFLISFLGTMAGLWVTILLLSLAMLLSIVVVGVKLGQSANNSITKVTSGSILHLDLDMNVAEWDQEIRLRDQLLGQSDPMTTKLTTIVDAIDYASTDDNISGIFIDCNGIGAGMAQLESIGEALQRFKDNDKWVYAYGDNIAQNDYYLASYADSLFLNPAGSVDIHGLTMLNMHYHRLLQKLGVEMQVVKVGTYKSAVEPYILDEPSEANIEQQKLFLNNVWDILRGRIAENRSLEPAQVDSWVDTMLMTQSAQFYLSNHVVDRLLYRHQMLDNLKEKTGKDKLNLVELDNYSFKPSRSEGETRVAVYFAEGAINDEGSTEISGRKMVKDLLKLAEDDDYDALVIRVNSPGGSAFASEQIWEAVGQYKAQTSKPVWVSMSDYAASGGYYISCGADRIYAQPTTLTGSIGIFGMIPNANELLSDKLGISIHPVSTNPKGLPLTIFEPMTEAQRASMQSYVDRGYELFVRRVAEGRKLSVDSVKQIAEGRVWDGRQALRLGLVDKIGSLDTLLDDLAQELNADNISVDCYPGIEPNFFSEMLRRIGKVDALMPEDNIGDYADFIKAALYLRQASPLQALAGPFVIR